MLLGGKAGPCIRPIHREAQILLTPKKGPFPAYQFCNSKKWSVEIMEWAEYSLGLPTDHVQGLGLSVAVFPTKAGNTGIVLTELEMVEHQVVGGALRPWTCTCTLGDVHALLVIRSQRKNYY